MFQPYRHLVVSVILAAILLGTTGCELIPFRRQSQTLLGTNTKVNREKARILRNRLEAFVDRYLSRIEQASDEIQIDTLDPWKRRYAQEAKYYPSIALIHIVSEEEPRRALVNCVVMMTLERSIWQEPWGEEALGPSVELIRAAHDALYEDILSIARSEFTASDIADIQLSAMDWRKKNSNWYYVSTVRLDDVQSSRAAAGLPMAKLLSELDPLPSLSFERVTEQAADLQELAERAFFVAQRTPIMLAWQSELLYYRLATTPEVDEAKAHLDRLSLLADSARVRLDNLPALIDEQRLKTVAELEDLAERQRSDALEQVARLVAEERSQILDEIDQRQHALGKLLEDSQRTIASADTLVIRATTLSESLNELLETAGVTVEKVERITGSAADRPAQKPDDPSKPKPTLEDYVAAIETLNKSVESLSRLVDSTGGLVESPAITELLEKADGIAIRRLDDIFWRALILILVAAASLLVVLLVIRKR